MSEFVSNSYPSRYGITSEYYFGEYDTETYGLLQEMGMLMYGSKDYFMKKRTGFFEAFVDDLCH